MIEINILEFIPQEPRKQAQDTLVDFVSEQAKKYASDGVANELEQLLAMKLSAWRDDLDISDARRLLQEITSGRRKDDRETQRRTAWNPFWSQAMN